MNPRLYLIKINTSTIHQPLKIIKNSKNDVITLSDNKNIDCLFVFCTTKTRYIITQIYHEMILYSKIRIYILILNSIL